MYVIILFIEMCEFFQMNKNEVLCKLLLKTRDEAIKRNNAKRPKYREKNPKVKLVGGDKIMDLSWNQYFVPDLREISNFADSRKISNFASL